MELVFFGVFILLSAFFSGTETVFFSINRIRLHARLESGDRRAGILDRLLRRSEDFIGTILLGSNVCDVATVLSLNAFLKRTLGADPLVPVYNTLILTPTILIFSTLIPKVVFRSVADTVAYPLSYVYAALYYLLYPFQIVFTRIIRAVLSVFGIRRRSRSSFSREEFHSLLDMTSRKGLIRENEKKFIESIMEFKRARVREIMIPLVRTTCVEENEPVEVATALMLSTGHTRLPVFRMRVDNMVGYIENKDLISAGKHDRISKYVRPSLYIPETATLDRVLARMQDQAISMAFAVDEYGGASGIVGSQDIITEILGRFVDMSDTRIRREGKTLIVSGLLPFDDLAEELRMGEQPDKPGFETVAGFLLERFGRIPREGETVDAGRYVFEIESATATRIKTVRIRPRKKERRRKS